MRTAIGEEAVNTSENAGEWRAQALWVIAAGLLGFAQTAVFSGYLQMGRPWFLIPYVVITGAFLYAYFSRGGVDFGRHLRSRWVRGLTGAVVFGAFMVASVLAQRTSPQPGTVDLMLSLVWLGIVYGTVDALLLNVLPVLATWRALTSLSMTDSWPGRVLTGTLALFASLFVTAAYHLGYLIAANPLAAIGAHVALHLASVLHGIDTTVTLPPHY